MAAAVVLLQGFCVEATCSICLEYFHDPVITECGHTFCLACLTQSWKAQEGKEIACPQCRGVVQRNLIPNRPLANLVEKLRRQEDGKVKERKGVCEKHQEPLKLFCKDDEAAICAACDESKEHLNHQRIPLVEAAQDYQDRIQRSLEFLATERTKLLAYKAETEDKSQELLKQTKAEVEKATEQFRKLRCFLNEQEKLLLAQLEEVEKAIAKEKDEHLAGLSEELSSLGRLYLEMEKRFLQPPGELLQDISSFLHSHEKKETLLNPVIFPPELKFKFWDARDRNTHLVKNIQRFIAHWLPGSQLKENVTMDPDTACPCLLLSENHKRVNYEAKYRDLPENPKRFDVCPYVLGREGFVEGRHCWEVTLGKEGVWGVGVARKSIQRKGDVSAEEGIWAVALEKSDEWGGRCQYIASNQSLPPLSRNLRRVQVSLDCEEGELAFYDGDTGFHFYTFSGVSCSGETLLPFFCVYGDTSLTISP